MKHPKRGHQPVYSSDNANVFFNKHKKYNTKFNKTPCYKISGRNKGTWYKSFQHKGYQYYLLFTVPITEG